MIALISYKTTTGFDNKLKEVNKRATSNKKRRG